MQEQEKDENNLSIDVENKKVVINHLCIDNEEVVSYFQDVPVDARLERLEQAIVVGTVSLKTMGTYEKIDLIEKKFGELESRFDTCLNDALTEIRKEVDDKFGEKGDVKQLVNDYFSETGLVPKLIRDHFGKDGRVVEMLETHFGKEGDIQSLMDLYFGEKGELKRTVDMYFGEKGAFKDQAEKYIGDKGKLVEILNPNTKGTPLYSLLEEIREENKKLHDDIVKQVVKEEDRLKSTLKGYDFEDQCYELLCSIAKREKPIDTIEDVSKSTSEVLFGSMKGDFVVGLKRGSKLKFVVEAKNITDTMSAPDIRETLEKAKKARDAQYAVLMVRDVRAIPKYVGRFNEVADDMLVCALSTSGDVALDLEMVDITYHWAKLQTLKGEAISTKKLDSSDLVQDMKRLKTELTRFDKIATYCDTLEDRTQAIRGEAESLKSELARRISEIVTKLQ